MKVASSSRISKIIYPNGSYLLYFGKRKYDMNNSSYFEISASLFKAPSSNEHHCVKSVRIRSFSPYSVRMRENTD